MQAVYQAYERNAALILASEQWADGFSKTPELHGKLLGVNARLERKILTYFRDQAKKSDTFIDWRAYQWARYEVKASRVNAYDVNVIVNDDAVSADDAQFITVVFEELATAAALGAQAAETIYHVPLGLDKYDADIQRLVREQTASLIGKKIDPKTGQLIDNPKSTYVISQKTRDDIRESIHRSLDSGEDVQTAAKRLQSVVRNPKRAQTIANTETVNAYSSGTYHFGKVSKAIGKEWTDNGAKDICAVNTRAGIIRFTATFPSGHTSPTAHPNCRCYIRLVYQNELDENPNLFD